MLRRTKQFIEHNQRPILPSLEATYLFYGISQLNDELLNAALADCDSATANAQTSDTESILLVQLIRASILRNQHKYQQAEQLLLEIDNTHDSVFKNENYIVPFARFDLASTYLEQVAFTDKQHQAAYSQSSTPTTSNGKVHPFTQSSADGHTTPRNHSDRNSERMALLDKAKHMVKRCNGVKRDYNFRNRLHLRAHLLSQELTGIRTGWASETPDDDSGMVDMHGNDTPDVDNMTEQQLRDLITSTE